MQIIRIISLVLIILTFTNVPVYAHKPIFIESDISSFEKAKRIENPQISWAIYSEIESKGQVDFYVIEGQKGMELFIQMTIPKIKGHENFKPTIAIIGKGLPKYEGQLPFHILTDYGVKIIKPTSVREVFFEPFTQTRYLIRQEDTINLPQSDKYYIAVFNNEGQVGKYTLAIGREEKFGFTDFLKFPYTWLKVRLWYNTKQTIVILILLFAVVFLLYRILNKRKG